MMRRAITASDLSIAVDSWDRHVSGCGGCLNQGMSLCPEGTYLAEDVIAVRSAYEHRMAKIELARGVIPAIGVEA